MLWLWVIAYRCVIDLFTDNQWLYRLLSPFCGLRRKGSLWTCSSYSPTAPAGTANPAECLRMYRHVSWMHQGNPQRMIMWCTTVLPPLLCQCQPVLHWLKNRLLENTCTDTISHGIYFLITCDYATNYSLITIQSCLCHAPYLCHYVQLGQVHSGVVPPQSTRKRISTLTNADCSEIVSVVRNIRKHFYNILLKYNLHWEIKLIDFTQIGNFNVGFI